MMISIGRRPGIIKISCSWRRKIMGSTPGVVIKHCIMGKIRGRKIGNRREVWGKMSRLQRPSIKVI